MSFDESVPVDPGPMDVEDSIPAPTPTASGDASNKNSGSSGSRSSASRGIGGSDPEIAIAGGGFGGDNSNAIMGRNQPPPQSAEVTEAAGAEDSRAAVPEENAEPPGSGDAEVELVPLPPSFDLDAYISRYSGFTKIRRLEWIAQRCPALAPDCYKTALTLLRQGINTQAYREISARASQLLDPEYAEDPEWIEQIDRRYLQSVDRLEAELNSYKTNMIKESVRIGYNELGDLYYRRGDLKQALKYYARTRDYCTTNRHSAEMCLHVIEISADMRNFIHVNNYVLKAEHTPDLDEVVVAKLRAAAALVFLDQKEYAKAARKLVEVSPELGSSFDGVVAPEDIAVYGGLCALATFSREEMKRKVLDNTNFKNFLDLVPQMRELINDFACSRYKSCLSYLANLKGDLQLDLHLHMHLDRLYKMVEDKCLMQYFSPYTSVRLGSMAEAFGMEVPELEAKIAALIISKQIAARIDSTKATLHAKHTEQRGVTCRKMHEMGDSFQRELRAMLIRMSCIEHDFIVRGRGLGNLSGGLLGDAGEMTLGTLSDSGAIVTGGGGSAGCSSVAPSAAASASATAEVNATVATDAGGGAETGARQDFTAEGDAGGPDAGRPPEAGGGSSSMTSEQDDAMETVV